MHRTAFHSLSCLSLARVASSAYQLMIGLYKVNQALKLSSHST